MKPPAFFIGSLPFLKPEVAIQFVKSFSSHLPFLPQLPDANPQEDMIGQVLRGFELGHWDEKASSCLELFQNEFADSPRCKIQIAGPFTVSKSMSVPFDNIEKQWLGFWAGLRTQLRQGAFRGELWLQLDEPFWNAKQPLPNGYERFLEKLRTSRTNLRLGMHSCATERPQIPKGLTELCDFFSFDFFSRAITEEEKRSWEKLLAPGRIQLVFGLQGKDVPVKEIPLGLDNLSSIWLSATCGLYGWTPKEISHIYGNL